jgi:hypothetical protein
VTPSPHLRRATIEELSPPLYVHADTLALADSRASLAHHALGRLFASDSEAEFTAAVTEFLGQARAVCQSLARLRETCSPRGPADVTHQWLSAQIAALQKHPLELALKRTTPPAVYSSRMARGSAPPPFAGEPLVVPAKAVSDEFFFEGIDKLPALELCASFLERVTAVLDETRHQLKLAGLQ